MYQMRHIKGGDNIKEFIKSIFLFDGIDEDSAFELCKNMSFESKKYMRGERIFTPDDYSADIGFVYKGECEIRCHKTDGRTVLNSIKEGESFGILAALGKNQFPTEVWARKNSTVVFISKNDLIKMIQTSSDVAMNIIDFLAEKVDFLNRKINTVTQGSVEKKLAAYILLKAKNDNSTCLELNLKKCSESISAGRASVYRALENLKSKGYVTAENKKINILNLVQLEEFSK